MNVWWLCIYLHGFINLTLQRNAYFSRQYLYCLCDTGLLEINGEQPSTPFLPLHCFNDVVSWLSHLTETSLNNDIRNTLIFPRGHFALLRYPSSKKPKPFLMQLIEARSKANDWTRNSLFIASLGFFKDCISQWLSISTFCMPELWVSQIDWSNLKTFFHKWWETRHKQAC